jgi:putative membrane protein
MSASSGFEAVIAFAIIYAIGLARIWRRVGFGRLVSPLRASTFGVGLAVLAVALGPPLDTQVGHDLSLHMTQHVLMIWVAAPLLVVGAPFPTLFWALPNDARARVQPRWQRVHREVAGDHWPVWIAVASFAQAIALGVWHLPALYQRAAQDALVHSLEHASFLFTALFFWWTIAAAVRRTRFGAGVLAVFIAKFPGLILGVGMTLAKQPWYPTSYGTGAAALRDQQGAGAVMWVGGGMIATIAGLALFWHWMQALERATPSDPFAKRVEGIGA